jgi:hypothetical protein
MKKTGIKSLKNRILIGGVYNYLGNQKTANAPLRWKSSPTHPVAYLTYITKEEANILIKKNIYGSLKNGKPNKGPFGIPSLQGSGSGSEGAGTADSSSSSQAGDASYSDYSDASMGTPGPGAGAGIGASSGAGTGISTISGIDDLSQVGINQYADKMSTSKEQEEGPKTARLSPMGIAAYNMSLTNPEKTTSEKAIGFAMSPISTLAATAYDSYARGARAPDDYSQLTESVQTSAPSLGQVGSGGGEEKLFKSKESKTDYLTAGSGYKPNSFYVKDTLSGGLRSLN